MLTKAFSVMWPDAPHRVLQSSVDRAEALDNDAVGEVEIGGTKMPVPRLSVLAPTRQTTGSVGAMALYAGESVTDVTGVVPARTVVLEIATGAEQLLRRWG